MTEGDGMGINEEFDWEEVEKIINLLNSQPGTNDLKTKRQPF